MIPHIPTQPQTGLNKRLWPVSLALVLAAAGYADAANYRYYRFTPTQLGSGVSVQFSEFEFYKGATKVAYPTGTTVVSANPAADGGTADANGVKSEGPTKLIDGLTATKWYNGNNGAVPSSVTFDVGATDSTKTLDVDGYRFATANDSVNRNPVSWKLEGSSDNTNWVGLDIKTGYTYTTATQFLTYTPVFTLPATLPPAFTSFTPGTAILKNGDSSTLSYTVENATSIAITPTTGVSPATPPLPNGSLTINPATSPTVNQDTAYTLTASSTQNTTKATQNFTLRTVAGGASSYQFVRFTPTKSGGAIQLADLLFYNGDVAVTATSANYDGVTAPDTDAQGPNKLIDNDAGTKWYSGTLRPVVIDFGSTQTFDNYSFTIGGDTATYPGRNPQRWIMEGSSTAGGPWTLIENVTAFDYNLPATNGAFVSVPLPGVSLVPIVTQFSSLRDSFLPDSPTSILYAANGAPKVTLQTGAGAEVELPQDINTVDVTPTAKTVYTLRAYAADNNTTKTVVKTLTLDAKAAAIPATINYTDFSKANDVDFSLLGSATFVNDSFAIPLPGDVTRLRVNPDSPSVSGAAWFKNKVSVGSGFDTTFYAHPTTLSRGYGAEGLAFVIQNSTDGITALPANPEKGPLSNAFTVELSTWTQTPDSTATNPLEYNNEAMIRVIKGTGGTATELTKSNLYHFPAIVPFLSHSGYYGAAGDYNSAPYKVRVTLATGKLNVYVNDTQVITDFATTLGDAVDADGKAWVGFGSRSGGVTENNDITSWTLTSATTTPTADLKITASAFDFTANTLHLTFASASGTSYKVTHSATLSGTDWIQAGTTVTATGASTDITVPFTKGAKDFFRVETTTAP